METKLVESWGKIYLPILTVFVQEIFWTRNTFPITWVFWVSFIKVPLKLHPVVGSCMFSWKLEAPYLLFLHLSLSRSRNSKITHEVSVLNFTNVKTPQQAYTHNEISWDFSITNDTSSFTRERLLEAMLLLVFPKGCFKQKVCKISC